MNMIRRILRFLFRRKPSLYFYPDGVECPPQHRKQIERAFWTAATALSPEFGHAHRIRRVRTIPGTVLRPRGWAVPLEASPSGYAGGWTDDRRREIVAVSDPNTGALLDSTLVHEWGEAILFAAGIREMEMRHKILGTAKI